MTARCSESRRPTNSTHRRHRPARSPRRWRRVHDSSMSRGSAPSSMVAGPRADRLRPVRIVPRDDPTKIGALRPGQAGLKLALLPISLPSIAVQVDFERACDRATLPIVDDPERVEQRTGPASGRIGPPGVRRWRGRVLNGVGGGDGPRAAASGSRPCSGTSRLVPPAARARRCRGACRRSRSASPSARPGGGAARRCSRAGTRARCRCGTALPVCSAPSVIATPSVCASVQGPSNMVVSVGFGLRLPGWCLARRRAVGAVSRSGSRWSSFSTGVAQCSRWAVSAPSSRSDVLRGHSPDAQRAALGCLVGLQCPLVGYRRVVPDPDPLAPGTASYLAKPVRSRCRRGSDSGGQMGRVYEQLHHEACEKRLVRHTSGQREAGRGRADG